MSAMRFTLRTMMWITDQLVSDRRERLMRDAAWSTPAAATPRRRRAPKLRQAADEARRTVTP
jgi:hypothetical protein